MNITATTNKNDTFHIITTAMDSDVILQRSLD